MSSLCLLRINVMRNGTVRLANIEYIPKLSPSIINTNQIDNLQIANYSSNSNTNTNPNRNPIIDQYIANKENNLSHRLNNTDITNMEFDRKLKKLEEDVAKFNNINKEFRELKTDLNYVIGGLILTQIAFITSLF